MTRDEYATLHHRMIRQREERQWLGVGLRPGDLIQAHVGGEIREVVEVGSAGDCIEAAANERARLARENKGDE